MYEWTKREDSVNEEAWGVDVAVFKDGYRTAYKNESVTVYAVDRNEAAQKARIDVGRGDEWVKVIRVWNKRR
jgi:hypothetical protein